MLAVYYTKLLLKKKFNVEKMLAILCQSELLECRTQMPIDIMSKFRLKKLKIEQAYGIKSLDNSSKLQSVIIITLLSTDVFNQFLLVKTLSLKLSCYNILFSSPTVDPVLETANSFFMKHKREIKEVEVCIEDTTGKKSCSLTEFEYRPVE